MSFKNTHVMCPGDLDDVKIKAEKNIAEEEEPCSVISYQSLGPINFAVVSACPESSPDKSDLQDLMRQTTGAKTDKLVRSQDHSGQPKPFKCDVCSKAFVASSKLSEHKRTHTGERPFKCNVCDKAFAQLSTLNRHKRTHTGEKQFRNCLNVSDHEKTMENYLEKNVEFAQMSNREMKGDAMKKSVDIQDCGDNVDMEYSLSETEQIHPTMITTSSVYPHTTVTSTVSEPSSEHQSESISPLGNINLKRQVSETTDNKLAASQDCSGQSTEQKIKCDVCGKKFKSRQNLTCHKRIHTGEEDFKCDICHKTCVSLSKLSEHKRIHTGDRPFKCNVCDKAFTQTSTLNRHKQTHRGEKKCRKSNVSNHKTTLENSLENVEFAQMSNKEMKDDSVNKFVDIHRCEDINMEDSLSETEHTDPTVTTTSSVYPHTTVASTVSEPSSESHDETISNLQDPKRQVSEVSYNKLTTSQDHSGQPPQQKITSECDVCGKKFKSKWNLICHRRIHTGEEDFMCDICRKTCVSLSKLSEHKRIHTGERPFKCDVCNKTFTQTSTLNRHKRTHTGEKKFGAFSNVSNHESIIENFLEKNAEMSNREMKNDAIDEFVDIQDSDDNMDINMEDSLSETKQIDPTVTTTSYVYQHTTVASIVSEPSSESHDETILPSNSHVSLNSQDPKRQVSEITSQDHSGQPTQQKITSECDVCGKKFKSKGNLICHTRIHTGEEDFICDVCRKTCVSLSKLSEHKRIHTGERPFKCDVCNKAFTQTSTLNRHKRTHTRKKKFRTFSNMSNHESIIENILEKNAGMSNREMKNDAINEFVDIQDSDDNMDINMEDSLSETKQIDSTVTTTSSVYLHTTVTSPVSEPSSESHDETILPSNSHVSLNSQDPKRQVSEITSQDHSGQPTQQKITSECDVCGKKFKSKGNLICHTRIHTGEEDFMCDICRKTCVSLSKLSEHKRIHTGERPFKCDVCDKAFTQTSTLNRHKRTHTRKNKFRTFSNMSNHESIIENILEKNSEMSNREMKDDAMNEFVNIHDCDDNVDINMENSLSETGQIDRPTMIASSSVHPCTTVTSTVSEPSSESHDENILPNNSHVSNSQDPLRKTSERTNNMLATSQDHLGQPTQQKITSECDVCGKKLKSRRNLICHRRIHTGEEHFKCDICHKKCVSLSKLSEHKRTHTGDRPFKCNVCNKTFTQTSTLNRHKITHTREKKFRKYNVLIHAIPVENSLDIQTQRKHECDVCDKKFKKQRDLIYHQRIHTREDDFKCDACGKLCVSSSKLSEHKRIHTGEKPFKCDICDMRFSQTSTLTRHKRTHTGEKPFNCDVCVMTCADSSTLCKHKTTHTGVKPYGCDCCGRKFARSSTLSRHKITHKAEETSSNLSNNETTPSPREGC